MSPARALTWTADLEWSALTTSSLPFLLLHNEPDRYPPDKKLIDVWFIHVLGFMVWHKKLEW